MLLSLMYGLSLIPSAIGVVLALTGLGGLLAFVWWEARTVHPVFDVRLFGANTVFAFSNLAALINYSATYAVTFLLSLYLQYQRGMSPRDAGIVLVAQPIMMALLSPLAGRLSDRIEPRIVSSIGMGLAVVGLALLTVLSESTGIAYVVVCLVVLGVGFALFSSPNTNAIMGAVDKRFYGVASGTLGTMRLVGQVVSLGIVTLLLSIFVGRVQVTPDNYALFLPPFLVAARIAFVSFAVLCSVGVLFSLARGRVRGQQSPQV
jgi:MFS family permease